MTNFTSELSDCSTVHIIQSITGSMLDSPCFHSLWRSLSVSSHSLFGNIEFYSQKETERYLRYLILCVTETSDLSKHSQTCSMSFSFQDQSDKIFVAFLNFISLFDNCSEQVCCIYSKQKRRNERVNKYH